ncbi:MAG: LysM peptidoglycan-binding domain-containing protein [Bacilli bacterium]|nr:LysM peptidoglycan-binding domain-containing protein [Bacilli bacterium]
MFEGVIIDAGHGGIDSGAVGNNLLEKDLNLKASNYMYKRLQELGIPSKVTRDSDEYLPKDKRIRRVLGLYDNNPNTILISNHINAGGGEGAEVVYSLKNDSTLADMILENIGDAGQIKRKTYQRRLPENPNKDYYYILRETGNTMPLLVEYGFIDNKNDAYKLNNNLEDYVEGVVKAIAEYTGYNYIPPNGSISNDYYTVVKGDTLYSISRRFNVSIDEIKRINNLDSNILTIGQKLFLTDDIDDNIDNYDIYEVVKGDSLYSIAKRFNINLNDLININNLDTLVLQIGQKLLVPKTDNNNNNNTYIVQKGDTLWSIAKKNNISVNELKELNNLSNNLLSIGQVIRIK